MNEVKKKLRKLISNSEWCSVESLSDPDFDIGVVYTHIPDEIAAMWDQLSDESRMVAVLTAEPYFQREALKDRI